MAGVLTALGRKAFDMSGYILDSHLRAVSSSDVPKGGDQLVPIEVEDGYPIFPENEGVTVYRRDELIDFVVKNELDTLIIVGCAFGRELFPFAEKYFTEERTLNIIGADISIEALTACETAVASNKFPWLKNISFQNVNIEKKNELDGLIARAEGRIGFYMCETSHYIFPKPYEEYIRTIGEADRVVAFQLIEATLIDSFSRYEVGMVFSYQKGFWRHNFPKLIGKYFTINKTFFTDPQFNSKVHSDQYYWFISASKRR